MSRGFESGSLPEHVRRLLPATAKTDLGKAGLTMPEIAAKEAVKRERELHDQIASYLRIKGVRVLVHSRMDKRTTQQKGLPDFLFCWQGRPVAIEVKRPGENPTEEQVRVLADLRADGWSTALVRSLDEVILILGAI